MRHILRAKHSAHNRQKGFTLIEVLVIAPILLISISVIIVALVDMIRANAQAREEVNMLYNIQTSLNVIENDTRLASAFLTTKDASPIADPYGFNNSGGTWSYKGTSANARFLITRNYATTNNPLSATKEGVYENSLGCGTDKIYLNPVVQYNAVYFVRNNTLFKRVLTDTTKTTCNTLFQKQSCPTDVTYPRNTVCKADDMPIMNNVTKFDVSYYSSSASTTPMNVYSSTDPAVLNSAKTVDITIESQRLVQAEPLTRSLTIRINKLN